MTHFLQGTKVPHIRFVCRRNQNMLVFVKSSMIDSAKLLIVTSTKGVMFSVWMAHFFCLALVRTAQKLLARFS